MAQEGQLQKSPQQRMVESRTLTEFKKVISSILDIQNKMASCDSEEETTHLNDDYPLGNYDINDEINIKTNFVLFRTACDLGAPQAAMNFKHENDEIVNITRGRRALTVKLLRSNISQSDTRITEDSGGGFFRRNKEASQ